MAEKEQEQYIPSLGDLTARALNHFDTTEGYTNDRGRMEGYGVWHAVEEAINKSGLPPAELLVSLMRQTTFLPSELEFDSISGLDSWGAFCNEVSMAILHSEVKAARPDAREVEDRRMERADEINRKNFPPKDDFFKSY